MNGTRKPYKNTFGSFMLFRAACLTKPRVAVIVEAIGKDGLVRADLEHVLPDWNRWRAAAAKEAA